MTNTRKPFPRHRFPAFQLVIGAGRGRFTLMSSTSAAKLTLERHRALVGARARLIPGGWVAWVAVCALWVGRGPACAGEKIDFNFQIRPVLSEHCFKCHGPDEKARKAKLRLDQPESAFAVRDKGSPEPAIVPRHPEQSELVRRITASNGEDRMPPLASKLALSKAEIELLRGWVAQGAEYKAHWAFVPLGPTSVPRLPEGAPAQNPIDAFVLAGLRRAGVKPSPEASRETLVRRLSFDLRGLPPTLDEIDSFVADTSPQAYEALVDRLLASPAYGEKQANVWLDLARFADTYGYQSDVDRDLSPWRDWVIRAFNQNLPYDQFVRWQLAGDLLPNPTRDQVLATAFNRLHRQTNEGGSVEEEFRVEYVADRVATAGTAFLGLTLGCARCHDHKYDPITQKDFYRMSAFFDNIDESGLYAHFTHATPGPTLLLYPDGTEARHQKLQEHIRSQEAELARLEQSAAERFDGWTKAGGSEVGVPKPVAAFDFEVVATNHTPDRANAGRTAQLVDGPEQVEGKVGKALKFSGDNLAICQKVGAFNRTQPFSFSLWLKPEEKQERAVVFHRSRSWTDSGSRGYELVLEDGRPAFSLIHFWPGNALKVRGTNALPVGAWSHLVITYDGSSRASGARLYLNGAPLATEVVRDHLFKDILHREQWGDMDVKAVELTLAGRFRDSGFKNGLIDEFQVFDRCLTEWEAKSLAGGAAGAPDRAARLAVYVRDVDGPCGGAARQLHELREEENRLINDVSEIMVMREMSPRRPTFLLKRGAYDARGEPVEAGTPDKILPFLAEWPRNRLGLANWMLDRRNPLTARVAVNRIWRSHFGRGLVESEEDFGTQGKLPTQPELLDWLAEHFIETQWDVKGMHKLIALSHTYRQTSQTSAELLARDPDNHALARGPKHRLAAEEIRDNALAVSGLLSARIGGPSARPYQPAGLWEEAGTGKHYDPDKGEGLYRRSLYTFWRRTAPPPTMVIFDAPTREVCTARRETTATPLQALVLLNDPQFVEAGRVMAERLLHESGADGTAWVSRGFRLATGRQPKPEELAIVQRLYHEQLQIFQANPAAAAQYVKIGERSPDSSAPPAQLAAAAFVANTLMNLDEFSVER